MPIKLNSTPRHPTMHLIGIILLFASIIFTIIGISKFGSGFMSTPSNVDEMNQVASNSFIGILLTAIGGFAFTGALILLYLANWSKISRNIAGEAIPIANEASAAMTPSFRNISKAVVEGYEEAKYDSNLRFSKNDIENEKIMIRCQMCGSLNEENSKYCLNCGQKI